MIKMNEENRLIIKQLNKFGRVPETSELLKMIEDLQNNWNELKKWIGNRHEPKFFHQFDLIKKMQELEGNNEIINI